MPHRGRWCSHVAVMLAVIVLGPGCSAEPDASEGAPRVQTTDSSQRRWTCSMHPEIVRATSGRCPVCNMALEPMDPPPPATSASVVIDPTVVQNMGVRLGEVIKGRLSQTLRFLATAVSGETGPEVNLMLYDRHRPFIRSGQRVKMDFPGLPGKVIRGRVTGVSDTVDPDTRTFHARVALNGGTDDLRPGMFGTATILALNTDESLLVRREAIIDSGTRQVVFVAMGEGRFDPREIELGTLSEDWAQVKSGLAQGEAIVLSGQFLLDSESRLQEALAKHRTGTWEIPLFQKESAH